ncbi:MAG: LptF/LptG family permease [Sphaerochaeta sp.]|jgi:lipopolysaccharide export system permease protein|nr:LptF/LptG family permease [Sphaerochaeta sp.]MCH3920705.1 LptF/LptG family permease [Sphaerochaeta sp.]MCI2076569.1 LptF/LptG family permease [Sphaerochaeta sp.]MCI2096470.1 LptF/LptG family permease [Sphaerochaeta sp.]MCI2104766.1 LptF/LptG family permease [Sphaerochaeta sp.]
MKVVHRYVVGSVVKTALVTMLLCTLMLVSVQLFTNLDGFVSNAVPFPVILLSALLYVPTALIQSLAPSLLFAAAFTFSQLTANNELICLYNAGFSGRAIALPVLALGMLCCMMQFGLQEKIAIPMEKQRTAMLEQYLGLSSTRDSRNITLSDREERYVIHARKYDDRSHTLSRVTLLVQDEKGRVKTKVEAPSARWDAERNLWVFTDSTVTTVTYDGMRLSISRQATYQDPKITMKPDLFRDNSEDVKTMELSAARTFLERMKETNGSAWTSYRIDYIQRILGCLTPLVMLFIACTISYRFKKNVLLLTIIMSVCIAVIYYVTQMLTLLLARQGVIPALWGMVIPMIVIGCIAVLQRLVFGWTHG